MSKVNFNDYASIKNGSYGKLMKAYYAKQDAESASQSGDTTQKLTLMRSGADSLKKSAEALSDTSLYEKKKFRKKDEETGEEIEVWDYDWDAVSKAVKSFVDDYNSVVRQGRKARMLPTTKTVLILTQSQSCLKVRLTKEWAVKLMINFRSVRGTEKIRLPSLQS